MSTATDGANPLHDLTGFQRDLLVAIGRHDGEDPNGLELREFLNDAYDKDVGDEINHGRLYPNLDTLVDKGLVEKGHKDRRTNAYSLTARGERELDAHRDWMGAGE